MQANTCMSSSASTYVHAIARLKPHALATRYDKAVRGLPGRRALGAIYRLAQLMTGLATSRRKIDLSAQRSTVLGDAKPAGMTGGAYRA